LITTFSSEIGIFLIEENEKRRTRMNKKAKGIGNKKNSFLSSILKLFSFPKRLTTRERHEFALAMREIGGDLARDESIAFSQSSFQIMDSVSAWLILLED
jgi:hypothetical protein